jgi:chromosome partitioning protein
VAPETPGAARIIAIANQKGGVGKSTTAVSLGASLADLGYRVLVIDLDPQGNASTGMGIRHEAREVTVYDVVVAESPLEEAIVPTPVDRLHAVPSTIDLAGAEIELVSQFSREGRLKRAIEPVREGVYDFILLDCPPSLGLLTVNALTAAEELIVPIQCEYYALEGLGQLLRNVGLVQQNINQELRLSGIVMTMFDPRTKLSEQVVEEVRRYFGDLVYDVIIPRTVRLSEAPGYGQPITVYDPRSKGAQTYRELAREVALRPPPTDPMPHFDDLPTVVPPAVAETALASPPDEEVLDVLEVPTVHELEEELEVTPSPEEPAPPEVVPAEPEPEPEPQPEPQPEPEPEPQPEPEPLPPVSSVNEDDIWEEAERVPEAKVSPVRTPAPPTDRRVVVIGEDQDIDLRAGQEQPLPTPPAQEPSTGEAGEGSSQIGATLEDEDAPKRRWRLFRKGEGD